jgi:hypothetical protein
MLSVANKAIMLTVFMLSVVMLSVVMLNVFSDFVSAFRAFVFRHREARTGGSPALRKPRQSLRPELLQTLQSPHQLGPEVSVWRHPIRRPVL